MSERRKSPNRKTVDRKVALNVIDLLKPKWIETNAFMPYDFGRTVNIEANMIVAFTREPNEFLYLITEVNRDGDILEHYALAIKLANPKEDKIKIEPGQPIFILKG